MKWVPLPRHRVLALDPSRRGVGFAVIEANPIRLVDWGVKSCRASDSWLRLEKTLHLVELYAPETVVFENWRTAHPLRRKSLRAFAERLEEALIKRDMDCLTYSRADVRLAFKDANARTQAEIALLLASRFPGLFWRLPPTRKAWMQEDFHMAVFDAVAFGLTHLHRIGSGP